MEKCARCGRTEEEVRIFDGFYVNESVKICEKCALISNIPIIKTPSVNQLKESDRAYNVRQRLMRLNHLDSSSRDEKSVGDKLRELEDRPELEKPQDLVFKLVDNFHWIIQVERRRKGLSTKQLADSIGESESAIKMLEKGIVPSKSINLITAIEQFLKVNLIKKDFLEKIRDLNKEKIVALEPMPDNFAKLTLPEKPVAESKLVQSSIREEKVLVDEEIDEMVKTAIMQEKSDKLKKIEQAEGIPFGASEFRKKDANIIELRKRNEMINRDFSKTIKSEGEKSSGKTFEPRYDEKKVYGSKPKSSVPTIYELVKRKEERDKTIVGKDIDIVE